MMITCSCCGQHRRFRYSASAVNAVVASGWGSCGSALYCPDCTRTWSERNGSREMGGDANTVAVVDRMRGRDQQ